MFGDDRDTSINIYLVCSMNTIFWGALENIIYFPIIFLGILCLMYRLHRFNRVKKLLSDVHAHTLLKNGSLKKHVFKMMCVSLGILFLFVALLRPQWDKKEETVSQEGRDIFIALDISRSMLAADCAPNRLIFAKEKIKSLLKKIVCERVGLILFSGSAFVQCPLTTDYSAFTLFLDTVGVEQISSGTTALDQAVEQTLNAFANTARKSKLLIMLTDGEDFSHNLSDVRQRAAQEKLSILTVGVGTPEGAPVPILDVHGHQMGHQKDNNGRVVISRLNEGILNALSQDAGGIYIRSTNNDTDIDILIRCVQTFEKDRFDDKKIAHKQEQYHYCAALSFICFLVDWLL